MDMDNDTKEIEFNLTDPWKEEEGDDLQACGQHYALTMEHLELAKEAIYEAVAHIGWAARHAKSASFHAAQSVPEAERTIGSELLAAGSRSLEVHSRTLETGIFSLSLPFMNRRRHCSGTAVPGKSRGKRRWCMGGKPERLIGTPAAPWSWSPEDILGR